MRAGSLDRTIELQALSAGEPDEYGNVAEGWSDFATVRAQLVTLSTEEFLRGSGEASETAIVFRIRYLPHVTTAHRVLFEGRRYGIEEVGEIGRRNALELRCREDRA